MLADEFGFIPTKYVELSSLAAVRRYTDDVAGTGSWEGDMIEGFVVRCVVKDASDDIEGHPEEKPPYRPGAPFFFKVKFDEPYLLYRQWREVTRVMLPLLEGLDTAGEADVWKKVRPKNKRPEVACYADWVGATIKLEPELFDNYNKGVVRVRDRFLRWTEENEAGKKMWKEAKEGKYKLRGMREVKKEVEPQSREGLPKKWILVPIAVPGCGTFTLHYSKTPLTRL